MSRLVTVSFLVTSCFCQANLFAQWSFQTIHNEGDAGWRMKMLANDAGFPLVGAQVAGGNMRVSIRPGMDWVNADLADAEDIGLSPADDIAYIKVDDLNISLESVFETGYGTIGTGLARDAKVLGFDSQARPHVAYIDGFTNQLHHAKWNGIDWDNQVVATSQSFSSGSSFFFGALDGNDQAHFLFPDGTGVFDQPMSYARPDGSSWTTTAATTATGNPTSLQLDSENNPHFIYSSSNLELYYAFHDGSDWNSEMVTGVSNLFPLKSTLELVAGTPHVFVNDFSKRFNHIQLTEDGDWENEPFAAWGGTVNGPEAVDAHFRNGLLHVAYSTGEHEVIYGVLAVPEPSTIGLLLFSSFGLMLLRRFKTRQLS